MAWNQKGGVHTQKLKVFGIIAALAFCAVFCCFVADDADAANNVSESQFAKVGTNVTFTLTGDENYYYTAALTDRDGNVQSGAISTSDAKGSLGSDSTKEITVKAPSKSGDYTLTVKYYSDGAYESLVDTFTRNVKAVDPIVLKATITNSGDSTMELNVYFVINGEEATDSHKTVKVEAGKSSDVTYEYIVENVSQFKYCVQAEGYINENVIKGLGQEVTVFTSADDYTPITIFAAIIIVVMIVAMVFVLRKPVVNKGKPKARR